MTHTVSYQIDSISCSMTAEVMKPTPGFFKCPVSKVKLHEYKELKSLKKKKKKNEFYTPSQKKWRGITLYPSKILKF